MQRVFLVLVVLSAAFGLAVAAVFEIPSEEMAGETNRSVTVGLTIPKIRVCFHGTARVLDKPSSWGTKPVRCVISVPEPYDARMADVNTIRLGDYPIIAEYVPRYSLPVDGRVSDLTVAFYSVAVRSAGRHRVAGRSASSSGNQTFTITGRFDSSHDISFTAVGEVPTPAQEALHDTVPASPKTAAAPGESTNTDNDLGRD
jgi:hypothetical protein